MISAYAGDMSEEARSKLQTLQVQLSEAEEGLADTQNDHAIQQQQQIFDRLYQALSDHFSDIMENPTQVLKSTESLVNDNMPQIRDTLDKTMEFYDTNVSQSLRNILNENGLKGVKNSIAVADGDIKSITNSVLGETTELKEFYETYKINQQSEEELRNRMKILYGESKTGETFVSYFEKFNTKLESVNESINSADNRAKFVSELASSLSEIFMQGMELLTGNESITRDSDNATLTPIDTLKSSLSNSIDTVNKWVGISGISGKDLVNSVITPTSVEKKTDTTYNNSMEINVDLNNVSDPIQFALALKNDPKVKSIIKDMIYAPITGGSSMSIYKH